MHRLLINHPSPWDPPAGIVITCSTFRPGVGAIFSCGGCFREFSDVQGGKQSPTCRGEILFCSKNDPYCSEMYGIWNTIDLRMPYKTDADFKDQFLLYNGSRPPASSSHYHLYIFWIPSKPSFATGWDWEILYMDPKNDAFQKGLSFSGHSRAPC